MADSAGMNYYEELGVSPSASTEEIRQAYKELARLLPPDQQQDEALRRVAERQMKRLNQVVAVLSDPAERRRYDQEAALAAPALHPIPVLPGLSGRYRVRRRAPADAPDAQPGPAAGLGGSAGSAVPRIIRGLGFDLESVPRVNRLLTAFYPEAQFGGFSDIDGTVTFYLRVNSLLSPSSVVVDFGCGSGDYRHDPVPTRLGLRVLRENVKRVIGVDVDPRAAGNPFLDEFRDLEDEGTWPIESDSVDLVLCDSVLEHLANPNWFFSEGRRVLVPGGHLCIRTSNVLSYVGLISRLVPNRWHAAVLSVVQCGRADCFPTVYRGNTVWRLRRALVRHGFEDVAYGYEAEPSYLNFSKLAYQFGVWHERLAPGFVRPALFAFARRKK